MFVVGKPIIGIITQRKTTINMVVQCIVKIITKWNRKSDGYMVYIQYMIRIVYEHNIIVNVRVFLIQNTCQKQLHISNSLVFNTNKYVYYCRSSI